jgi:hypothetical protein
MTSFFDSKVPARRSGGEAAEGLPSGHSIASRLWVLWTERFVGVDKGEVSVSNIISMRLERSIPRSATFVAVLFSIFCYSLELEWLEL